MKLLEYKLLPDYMEPAEVERYCFLILQEPSFEAVHQTLQKWREMLDRQWHTYQLPSKELQFELKKWLIANWTSNSDEYLEGIMLLSFNFGLDKAFFAKALSLYEGKSKHEFQQAMKNSTGDAIDPWWSMKAAKT